MLTAVIAALAWLGSHSNTVRKTDHPVAGWTVTVRTDRFTGGVSCQARRGAVLLQGPVAVFAFARDVDTTDAIYRINQGPAHPDDGRGFPRAFAWRALDPGAGGQPLSRSRHATAGRRGGGRQRLDPNRAEGAAAAFPHHRNQAGDRL